MCGWVLFRDYEGDHTLVMDEPAVRSLIAGAVRRFEFGNAAVIAATLADLRPGERDQLIARATFGQRLLRLDLTDLELVDLPVAASLDPDLRSVARDVGFPDRPRSAERGSLRDLSGAIEHLLASVAVRWERHEVLHVLALLHLCGEYLGHLAWSGSLGHAGDPMAMQGQLGGRGSLWGDLDAQDCGHNRSQRHLAEALHDGDHLVSDVAFQRFLRDRYSQVGELLSTCATRHGVRVWGRSLRDCRAECTVWTDLAGADQSDLERRVLVAQWYRRSPLVRQRHASPMGHFFGVPERHEIQEAFDHLARRLDKTDLATIDGHSVPDQLASVCSIVAGKTMRAATLMSEVAARIGRSVEVA